MQNFERILFRATRGNMFLKQSEVGTVRDPATGDNVEKSVFVVFFAGERARTKIMKVSGMAINALHAIMYGDEDIWDQMCFNLQ